MIELRWLVESGVKRLQYRFFETFDADRNIVWYDWQDVPEVEGGDR